MFYCEKCKLICVFEYCSNCGSEKLREVTPEDFCFLVEVDEVFAKVLEDSFADNDIKCILMPSGNGVRSSLGLSLGNYIIYVPYQNYKEAEDIVEFFNQDSNDNLRDVLIKHIDMWNINKKVQKKLRKKFELTEDDDIF